MTQKSRTKDEQFIIKAYEVAVASGDKENLVDRYAVGQSIGLHPRAVDAICNLLVKANFVKKIGDSEIKITSQGERLVNHLLGNT